MTSHGGCTLYTGAQKKFSVWLILCKTVIRKYEDSLIIYRLCRSSKSGRAHRVWGLKGPILLKKLEKIYTQDVTSPLQILDVSDFGNGRGQRFRNQRVEEQLWPGNQHAHFQDTSVTRERPIKSLKWPCWRVKMRRGTRHSWPYVLFLEKMSSFSTKSDYSIFWSASKFNKKTKEILVRTSFCSTHKFKGLS